MSTPNLPVGHPDMTLNQMGAYRKQWFREAKRRLRAIDSLVEKCERRINRVLKRVKGYPTNSDLDEMHGFGMDANRALNEFIRWLSEYPEYY